MAIALLAAQPSIAAPTIEFTGFEFGSVDVNLGTTSPVPAPVVSHANVGAYNTKINGGATFESFCIDVWQHLSFNHDYSLGSGKDYTSRPSMVGYVTNAGPTTGITQATVDNLSRLYAVAHSSPFNTATQSAALQLAIWEIAYENPNYSYNLGSGNFYSTGSSAVTTLASQWLANLVNGSPTAYTVKGYTSSNYQDIIVFASAVPEPGTYAMMLAGLGLMGFVARCRDTIVAA